MPFFTIQGRRIFCRTQGEGRTVCFLHGLAAASSFWIDTFDTFGAGFRIVAPDLLGFGDSDKPRIRYTLSGHVSMIRELTEKLGIVEMDLVGHSMGGMIALEYALRFPEQLNKLVLMNAPISGRGALHGKGWFGATLAGLVAVRIGLRISPILWALRKIGRYYYVLDPRFTEDAKKPSLFCLRGHVAAIRETDLTSKLPEISVPTLVIGTRRDGIIRPEEFSRAARGVPGAETVWIPDAGHCPTLEKPLETHEVLLQFLSKHPS